MKIEKNTSPPNEDGEQDILYEQVEVQWNG